MATTTVTAVSRNDHDPLSDIIASMGRISLGPSLPEWSLINTAAGVSKLLDILSSIGVSDASTSTPPSLYIDLQGPGITRHGHISLLQIYVLPLKHTYLVDIQTLGQTAFTTAGSSFPNTTPFSNPEQPNPPPKTLKTILESPSTIKVFFDVRNDSHALHTQFNISLQGIHDLQLMELASRAISNQQSPSTAPSPTSSPSSTFTSTSKPNPNTPPPRRPPRRSLRHLNNLPRCIARDANLPLPELLSFNRWTAYQREQAQLLAANRELERLNKLVFNTHTHNHTHLGDNNAGHQESGYERFVAKDGIETRPLSEGVMGLCVMNVRFLGRLWGVYEGRMEMGGENGETKGEGEVWRRRVEEVTRERVEGSIGGGFVVPGWCKGRGKLVMLAPLGWDSLGGAGGGR